MSETQTKYPLLLISIFLSLASCCLFLIPANDVFSESMNRSVEEVVAGAVFPLLAPRLSSNYGTRQHPIFRKSRHHSGIDLAAPENSHVRTILPGVVIFADKHGGYGKLVTVRHQQGYASMYGHLSDVRVNVGQTLKGGQIIGRVGSTGWSTGAHLHFEWRRNGAPLDPLKVFPFLTEAAEG